LYLQNQFPENTIKPVSNHEGTKTQKPKQKNKNSKPKKKKKKERTTLFLSSFLPNPAA
jgi:hypothetical protein